MRTVVFLHGLLTDHRLWRKVVPELGDGIDAVTPTLPLGSHDVPVPTADLRPAGPGADRGAAARGGGLARRLAGRKRHRRRHRRARGRPPPGAARRSRAHQLRRLRALLPAAVPPAPVRRARAGRRRRDRRHAADPRRPSPADRLRQARQAPDRPRDHRRLDRAEPRSRNLGGPRRVLQRRRQRHLLDAVPRLRQFEKPVTLAWAREDRLVFPPSVAERLAGDFPQARIEWIEDS